MSVRRIIHFFTAPHHSLLHCALGLEGFDGFFEQTALGVDLLLQPLTLVDEPLKILLTVVLQREEGWDGGGKGAEDESECGFFHVFSRLVV